MIDERIILLRKCGVSYTKIANILGMSVNSVKKICAEEDADTGASLDKFILCKECGKLITQKGKSRPRIFCCDKCKQNWWNKHRNASSRKSNEVRICPVCKSEFVINSQTKQKYCSRECYWKSKRKNRIIEN